MKSTISYKEQKNTQIYELSKEQTELEIKSKKGFQSTSNVSSKENSLDISDFSEQAHIEQQIKNNTRWLNHLERGVDWAQ